MKSPHARFTSSIFLGVLATAGISLASAASSAPNAPKPTVITPPAVKDGSIASRAPFPSARPFDDTKGPDGQAIDKTTPPNTEATNPELGAPRNVRINVVHTDPAPVTTAVPVEVAPAADAALSPTGRSVTAVSSSIDAVHFAPTIRSATLTSREQVLADVETRMKSSDAAMDTFHKSTSEMSAEGRAQFKAASDDVKAKEKALKKSVHAARKASNANWDTARAQLAADYEAYAAALAQVDAAAGVAPVSR